ncbi:hypothetical protein [Chitinimonas sp.]|uniref:hypothetical protein n=1 Tax=Chitinimonas sp. TaxID=1934313 RepID=UPI0035AFE03A
MPDIDALPVSPAIRTALDCAIQSVLGRIYAQQALGRCATYAIVGARVLSEVLKHPYYPVCGGQVLDCGNGMYIVFYPGREERRRARRLGDMRDYHCWIQAQRKCAGSTRTRIEIVDFAARHDRASAEMLGVPFERASDLDYLWVWEDVQALAFPDSLRSHPDMRSRRPAWQWVDEKCTRLLLDMQAAQPGFYRQLSEAVIASLGEHASPANSASTLLTPQFRLRLPELRQHAGSLVGLHA